MGYLPQARTQVGTGNAQKHGHLRISYGYSVNIYATEIPLCRELVLISWAQSFWVAPDVEELKMHGYMTT